MSAEPLPRIATVRRSVALVCEPPHGGVAEHVTQLALGLGERGYEPVVLCPPAFRTAGVLRDAGVRVVETDLRRDYAHPHIDFAAVRAVGRALRRERVTLVHAHAAKAGVVARLAARLTGRPALYTPHCFPFVGEISEARRRFSLAVERALAPGTAAIVCVCEDEREVARAHGIRAPELAVVHNGCPPCDGSVEPDPRLVALGRPVVGTVTVLRKQKAVEVLLDAAPAVLAAVPEARIVVVGDGPERAALGERAAALGLDERVVFVPFGGSVIAPLRALDVFVLPSAWEAFPIGVLEAQACGVPQVATDVGGTREAVVPETGVLVPPRDPGALALALIRLLQEPETRGAMAAASRERHAARFELAPMLDATAALYDRVLPQVPR
jgi:glycosyltransferase involved in cell wall biosynthesis